VDGFLEALLERGDLLAQRSARSCAQEPDHWHRLLLRARRERPRRRAAEQRYEFATFQLIEWHSAPASQGQIAGYRIDHSRSADILNLVNSGQYRRGIVRDDGLRRTPPACGLPWCRSCAGLLRRNRSPAF